MGRKQASRDDAVWDGYAPTEEMIRRAEASKPFWAYWDKDWLGSVQELHDAFCFRSADTLVRSFNPSRIPRAPAEAMSREDREVYDRFVEWLRDVHDAGLKRYIPMVQGVVQSDDRCPDKHLFERMVGYHVKIRVRDMQRYLAQKKRQ